MIQLAAREAQRAQQLPSAEAVQGTLRLCTALPHADQIATEAQTMPIARILEQRLLVAARVKQTDALDGDTGQKQLATILHPHRWVVMMLR